MSKALTAIQLFVLCFPVLLTSTLLAQTDQAQACTSKNLEGAFGFTINGTNPVDGPYSLVGRFVADGRGHVTGKGIQSVSGEVSRPTFTGVYTVQTDCTGEAVLTFADGGSAPLQFVIEADGTQVAIIAAGANGPGAVNEVGTATKQFIPVTLPK